MPPLVPNLPDADYVTNDEGGDGDIVFEGFNDEGFNDNPMLKPVNNNIDELLSRSDGIELEEESIAGSKSDDNGQKAQLHVKHDKDDEDGIEFEEDEVVTG